VIHLFVFLAYNSLRLPTVFHLLVEYRSYGK
jgi:hypothetical protein